MKTIKYLSYMVLSTFVLSIMTSCEPKALTQDDVFLDPASLNEILADLIRENQKGDNNDEKIEIRRAESA